MLDEIVWQNVSKFAIFLEYENLCVFFILCYFIFLINVLSSDQHRPGHSVRGKSKVARNEKRKKTTCFHFPKVWQILKHFSGTFHQA